MSHDLYSPLFTDLYQLTMAYGYFEMGMHEREAACHLHFRRHPFRGHYALCCGLQTVIDYLKNWHFTEDDLAYLATLKNHGGLPLFSKAFLTYLGDLRFTCHLDAIPEGTVVFANEPLLRIEGPILQCQLLETVCLTIINFQTLIATKASRICCAAEGDAVIEFGMRRAQGLDGALSASRAAYIGGCVATSNVLAGKLLDIPVRGTHAHNWVVAFPSEQEAFDAYASIMPHDTILLVDTYDVIEGVKHAIITGKKLREKGFDLLGIRIDSGDLLSLSLQARQLLDEAGFTETQIVASNALNEAVIQQLKIHRAPLSVFGVGTHLVTAYDCPALEGVYKLSALRNQQGDWEYKLKLSEEMQKITHPGRHQIRRFFNGKHWVKDVIYDLQLGILKEPTHALETRDLLQPIFKSGVLVAEKQSIHDIRDAASQAVAQYDSDWKEKAYPVEWEKRLLEMEQRLVREKRVVGKYK